MQAPLCAEFNTHTPDPQDRRPQASGPRDLGSVDVLQRSQSTEQLQTQKTEGASRDLCLVSRVHTTGPGAVSATELESLVVDDSKVREIEGRRHIGARSAGPALGWLEGRMGEGGSSSPRADHLV